MSDSNLPGQSVRSSFPPSGRSRIAAASRNAGLCLIAFLVFTLLGVGGCREESAAPTPEPTPQSDEQPVEYDADSWRALIPDDCVAFFDGCNRCRRAPGRELAACTRKACVRYEEPICLDEEATPLEPTAASVQRSLQSSGFAPAPQVKIALFPCCQKLSSSSRGNRIASL
jgi:hypothetical protein